MGKAPCCSKVGLLKGPWSNKEDTLLTTYIQANGEGNWKSLPKNAGLLRCGKSCRLRWINYLRPGIKRGNISSDEDDLIIRLHSLLGNRWSLIAARLPGRTDNEIKNYWNTHLIKKLKSSGLQQMRANKTASKRLPKESKKNLARADYEKTNGYKKKKQDIKKSSINDGPNSIEVVDKIKIYVPKPIRFCSVFSNNNTENSAIVTRASPSYWEVNKEAKVVDDDMLHFDWPICEQVCEDDQVLGQGCDFLFKDSISTMFNMQAMDKAYEEFLQSL